MKRPLAFLAFAFLATSALSQKPAYPETAKQPVTDTLQGVAVRDDYRWLENGADPAVRRWSLAQLEVTRRYLDALPMRAPLKERFAELLGTSPVRYFDFEHRGYIYALKRVPPANQPVLVRMRRADVTTERDVFDPNMADPTGRTAIDFFAASPDSRFVAVVLSRNGSEDGAAIVIDAATGKRVAEEVPRVSYPTGGGSIAWDAKSAGFYYTRYPQGNERPKQDANFYQQVYYHKLGTPPRQDAYVIGKEFPRIAETQLSSTRDGAWLLASVANGDGGDVEYHLRNPQGAWTKVAAFEDGIRRMWLGLDGRLYALSLKGAPHGKVLAMPFTAPRLAEAKVVIAEGPDVIESVAPCETIVYVTYMAGGPSEIRMFDVSGRSLGKLPSEPVSTNNVGLRLGDVVLVESQSYVSPRAWYRYRPTVGKMQPAPFSGKSKVSYDDAEVVREMAVSKDGTKVPVNIVMRKGTKRDGSNPVLLTGYGAYGVNITPYFSEARRAWLDAGGIFAEANLRGGGEFGEEWHLAGNLARKQNVFDDMAAVAQHLVDRGYTRPGRLAAIGGSNGGLLMGAMITQHPDLFRAIVSEVGLYDMLRVELTPNGEFNTTEFGTVKDRAQFEALYAYSPYHRVKDGTPYPAVLLTSGENDGRVDPYNSRKMAARLQAATSSERPILLRIGMDTGHGVGTPLATRVEELADVYAFLMAQLGMTYPPDAMSK